MKETTAIISLLPSVSGNGKTSTDAATMTARAKAANLLPVTVSSNPATPFKILTGRHGGHVNQGYQRKVPGGSWPKVRMAASTNSPA
jgi:hypothetical protein